MALLTALQMFGHGDYDRQVPAARRRLDSIVQALAGRPVHCQLPDVPSECLPILEISVDEKQLGRTALEVCRNLRAGSPPCYVGHGGLHEGKLEINPLHLDDEQTAELARRLREALRSSSI